MRIDPVLAVAVCALGGALCVTAPLPVALVVAVVVPLLWRRVAPRVLVLGAVALALGAWRAARATHEFEHARIESRDSLGPPSRCAAAARVLQSPTWSAGTAAWVAELDSIDCEGRAVRAPLVARLHGGPDDLRRGDRLDVVLEIAPIRLFRNLELPDPLPLAARRRVLASGAALSAELSNRGSGLGALIDRARNHARRRLLATFSPEAQPLARALVLGESDLDPDDDAAFRKSGLSHLLAVSGTHLVLAVLALVGAIGALLVRVERLAARVNVARLSSGVGALLALAYADFAGGSGSAWRAAWMLAASLGARALGRQPSVARSIAASLLVGVALDPLVVFDVSFLLSFAATAGLVVIGPVLGARCKQLRLAPLRWLAASIATTLSAMLPCAPLLAILSPQITLAGILANVVAAPLGELCALPLCLVHPLLGAFPSAERGAALVASGALLIVRRVAHLSADASWAAVTVPPPGAGHFAVLGIAAVALLVVQGRGRRLLCGAALAAALVAVELAARRAGRPLGELRVATLDVGQGDATLIDLPDGRLMLIDGGGFVGSPVDPGRSVILPVLRERRRSRIDIAVLSHPHPDHFTGLATTLREVDVGELWDSGQGEAEGAGPIYAAMMADLRARGVPIRRPTELCGRRFTAGAAEIVPLAPCPGFLSRVNANDNSLVLRVSLGARAVLLTGDAELAEERQLLAAHAGELRADLLKVGHHGSRTSTSPALLDAVRPSVATLSCGVRNPYGHPHAVTLETLARAQVAALRLDRVGGVEWRTRGDAVWLRAFSEAR